jgi:hypothetical protein
VLTRAKSPLQPPGSPVVVTNWMLDEDYPVFPIGSKPKRMITCPEGAAEAYLIPGHSYLFKTAFGHRAQQVWSEIVAYQLANLTGLDVPPCFLAVDDATGETGALIEFFYNYPGEAESARFVHVADVLAPLFTDKEKGRPHGIKANLHVCRALHIADSVGWWGRVLAFDALIGNTDRHPENWGFLVRRRKGTAPEFELAPPFDTGTSLSYELSDTALASKVSPDRARAYISRGTHDCGWDLIEDGPTPHMDLCKRYAHAYPDAGNLMRSVIPSVTQVAEVLTQCASFRVGIPFSDDRASCLSKLIGVRMDMLRECLGG